ASDGNPATITVTGTGAFIALPKAFNGGEYAAAPPAADASVTYEVLDYQQGGSEELTITIDVAGDGSVFWTFVLIPNS
ncbi:MAG: PKD domain-containing protein, partial [Cyclobacteriaceae bacterium]